MEKYLIELLETNNRVIVPDLGAFIIRQQEPQELVFNDLLAFNDGMLTSHIKQQEGISMSKAQVKIEEFVDQVKQVLTKGDIYHLENLGYLKMDDSSKIEFSVPQFSASRAAVVSAATLGRVEDPETTEQPEQDVSGETPVEKEAFEEEAPVSEVPEVEAPFSEGPGEGDMVLDILEEEAPAVEMPEEEAPAVETPEEEAPAVEMPEEEALVLEVPEEEEPVAEIPEEEAPDKEIPHESDAEWKAPEGSIPDELIQEEAEETGSFTLEEQTADIEVDASEDKPLIPDPEEPPFLIEDQEAEEEKKVTPVGTSQARLEAAAEAAEDDEIKTKESEPESVSTGEPSIPYYVEREKSIRGIWPWVGGAAALIIILLVAAWFFFPDKVNQILGGKSAEDVPSEQVISGDPSSSIQETTSESQEGMATETTQEQDVIVDEAESAMEEAEPGQAGAEAAEETVAEPDLPASGQAKKYYVVAGMFSSQTNAENLVKTLTSQGHDAELFGKHGDLYAVSFSSHVLRAAAVEEMNRIREEINPDAWLLYY